MDLPLPPLALSGPETRGSVSAGASSIPLDSVRPEETVRSGTPRETLQKFEAMFLAQMLSTMLESTEASVGGDGTAGSVHAGWFADAVAEQLAERGGIGLAERLAELRLDLLEERQRR